MRRAADGGLSERDEWANWAYPVLHHMRFGVPLSAREASYEIEVGSPKELVADLCSFSPYASSGSCSSWK